MRRTLARRHSASPHPHSASSSALGVNMGSGALGLSVGLDPQPHLPPQQHRKRTASTSLVSGRERTKLEHKHAAREPDAHSVSSELPGLGVLALTHHSVNNSHPPQQPSASPSLQRRGASRSAPRTRGSGQIARGQVSGQKEGGRRNTLPSEDPAGLRLQLGGDHVAVQAQSSPSVHAGQRRKPSSGRAPLRSTGGLTPLSLEPATPMGVGKVEGLPPTPKDARSEMKRVKAQQAQRRQKDAQKRREELRELEKELNANANMAPVGPHIPPGRLVKGTRRGERSPAVAAPQSALGVGAPSLSSAGLDLGVRQKQPGGLAGRLARGKVSLR